MGDGMQWEAERPLRCRRSTFTINGEGAIDLGNRWTGDESPFGGKAGF
jgi:hypothetical protein